MQTAVYPVDYEKRALDVVKLALDDIPDCSIADYNIRFLGGAPVLILAFNNFPQLRGQPACAVRLVTISRSEPLKPGQVLEGDRLRRHVRDSIEHYLAKHGVRFPSFQEN